METIYQMLNNSSCYHLHHLQNSIKELTNYYVFSPVSPSPSQNLFSYKTKIWILFYFFLTQQICTIPLNLKKKFLLKTSE